jgi:hypothetical protein
LRVHTLKEYRYDCARPVLDPFVMVGMHARFVPIPIIIKKGIL